MRIRSTRLRAGMMFLALQAAVVGTWALAAPESFYSDFPSVGTAWVAALPPYNEHLVRDVGGLYLGYALLFAWAASSLQGTVVRGTLIAWLPFAVSHFVFHVTHLGGLSLTTKILQMSALGAVVVLPLILLISARRTREASTFSKL